MTSFQEWSADAKQRLLTKLVNRTFKKNPGLVDRLAILFIRKMIGEVPHDPELDHPD